MSIAFDATNSGETTSTSLTYSLTNSGNLLVVGALGAQAGDIVTGVTYNGTSLTLLDKQASSANIWTYVFYIASPSTGTNNIVVSVSTSSFIGSGAVSYTGADTTTPVDTSNKAQITGTPITCSITTTSNDTALFASLRTNRPVSSLGTNTTSVYEQAGGAALDLRSTANIASASSTSLSYTPSSSDPSAAYVIGSFRTAPTATASNNAIFAFGGM